MTDDEIAAALDDVGTRIPQAYVRPGPARDAKLGAGGAWRAVFEGRTVAVDGGHLHWTGATTGTSGTPVVALGGQVVTAYRLAFVWHHDRQPEGNVRPRCAYPRCVAGAHLADRRIREGCAS